MQRFAWLRLLATLALCWTYAEIAVSREAVKWTSNSRGSPARRIVKRDLPSEADRLVIVNEHNKYRKLEGASDMFALKYNDFLASMADEWAKRCDFSHGHPEGVEKPWNWVGQNLYAISLPKINYTRAILSWFVEKKDFQFDQVSCNAGRVCGHYTQVVWHETTDVGCAASICPVLNGTTFTNAGFIVCNYGPGGNYLGEKPYDKGTPCTECPDGTVCENGLCVDLKKTN